MANRNRMVSAISTILIIALLLSAAGALSAGGKIPPENPISSASERLYPETMSGRGSLQGTEAGEEGNGESDATNTPETEEEPELVEEPEQEEEPKPEKDPEPEDSSEPEKDPEQEEDSEPEKDPEQKEDSEPEKDPETEDNSEQQTPTEQEETSDTDPEGSDEGKTPDDSSNPAEIPEEGDGAGGGSDTGDNEGGGSDSGIEGDGNSSGDGNGGSEGGDGDGGEGEDNTPRIFTDLYDNMYLTESDLPDGNLQFQAYPIGEGNLSVSVRLQNSNTPMNGTILQSSDGKNYVAALVLNGANYITIYLKQDGENIAYVRYKISYYADKADEDHPEVGDCPPTIITSLDGESLDISSEHIVFWVRATMHPDLGGGTIFSNQIQVWLDGVLLENETGVARPEYDIHFPVPNVDDYATHVIRVLAWDGNGNSAYKYYVINYHRIPEGLPTGSVTVVLDATTVGLGILDMDEIEILGGESIASVVVRFLDMYGYYATYDGTTSNAFYLRTIKRADIGRNSRIPADLRELLERDGITFTANPGRDTLGEFDFTRGAGWMYSVGGRVYPGRGMSDYPAQPGSTIYLRFTLSYGKDIAGYDASGGGYGSLSSYCRVWINGTVQELGHDFYETDRIEPTETETGYIEYTCSKCHELKYEILPATGEDPPLEPGEDPPSEPGEDPPSEPGEDPPTEPGEDPPTEPGEDPPFEPGEDPPFEPGEDPPPEPGEDPPSEPGEDPPSEPGEDPPFEPGEDPPTEPDEEPPSESNGEPM